MSAQPQFTELDGAIEQVAIAESRARKAERELHRLKRQYSEVSDDDPAAADIRELLDLWWLKVKHANPNVAHGLDSTRAAKVRSTLKRRQKMARDQGLSNEYGLLMCRKAIIGITCDEWAMGRNPKSGGKSFNDIAEHILNTDHDVEKFAELFDNWCSHLTFERLPKEQAQKVQHARLRLVQTEDRRRERFERAEREDPAEAVLAALTATGWEWKCHPSDDAWRAQCPAHRGTHLNLAIFWEQGGRDVLRFKCFSRSCETPEILAALGLPLFSVYRHPKVAA
jgi:hypothetical protein